MLCQFVISLCGLIFLFYQLVISLCRFFISLCEFHFVIMLCQCFIMFVSLHYGNLFLLYISSSFRYVGL